MTRDFAIDILEQYREKPTLVNEIETVEEAVWLDEALDMAIKALEQEPCEDMTTAYLMGYYAEREPKYCDRNICIQNEYNGIGCNECEVTKSQEPKTVWIPVSERLPEEGVDILACFYTGEGNYKMMVSRRSDYNYWSGVGRTADMVAWMPLPEPYKEG